MQQPLTPFVYQDFTSCADPLTHRRAGMSRGPFIDGAASMRRVLGDVRRHPELAEGGDELLRVVALIGPEGRARPQVRGQRRLALRGPQGLRHAQVHEQPRPVLDQHVPLVDQLGLVLVALAGRPGAGSVVDACVALRRRSPWRFTVGLPGSSGGVGGAPLRLKLLSPAHASISVPSTVKCSVDSRCRRCAWARQLLGRDRRAARLGVPPGALARQLLQGCVHHVPDRPQRMVRRHTLFRATCS